MKRVLQFLFLISIIFAYSCTNNKNKDVGEGELKGHISISGAFALYPMAQKWGEEFMKLHPGVKIDISGGGAGKGMMDVLSGMVDLGMVSREVRPDEIKKGAWYLAVTKDAVVPVANASNPYLKEILTRGLTKEQFQKIFLSDKEATWGEVLGNRAGNRINGYTRSDYCGASEMWAKYLGKKQEDLQGTGVYGDPGIAEAVRNDKYGAGYNNVGFAYNIKTRKVNEGLTIIPIDLNADGLLGKDELFYGNLDTLTHAIKKGVYPSPPARELYFVSKGKPSSVLVREFLRFILTEGQKYIQEAGYVNLDEERLNTELKKME